MKDGMQVKLIMNLILNIEKKTNRYYRKSGVLCVESETNENLKKRGNSIKGESL